MTSHIYNIDIEYYSTDDKNKFLIVKTIEDNEDHNQKHYIIQTLRIYKEKQVTVNLKKCENETFAKSNTIRNGNSERNLQNKQSHQHSEEDEDLSQHSDSHSHVWDMTQTGSSKVNKKFLP